MPGPVSAPLLRFGCSCHPDAGTAPWGSTPVLGPLHYGGDSRAPSAPSHWGQGWTGVCWGCLGSCTPLLWGQLVPTAELPSKHAGFHITG